jgi:Cd2+/Zn2+-exporting ATPase
MKTPYLFDEFFATNLEESVSPFLTARSRSWGKHLSLKSSLFAAALLALSLASSPISSLCLAFVYFLVGIPALLSAIDDLKNLEINIDVLMTLAAFSCVLINSSLEGALLLVLFKLSHGMEEMVSKRTRSAVHNLHTIAPKFALVLDEEGLVFEKSVKEIEIGSKVIVKQGEVVPLDGIIWKGASSLNLVHLTGESLPVMKIVGDSAPAGARNLESAITIQVTRKSSDSTLARLMLSLIHI